MLSEFNSRGRLNKEINATFICLVPKVPNPTVLHFRPISLVQSIYKLLSKILANKLKRVLPLIISP